MLDQTRGKQVTDRKRATLVGLIGTSLQFSRAPEIHMREGICNGLQYIYLLIDLSALDLGMDAPCRVFSRPLGSLASTGLLSRIPA